MEAIWGLGNGGLKGWGWDSRNKKRKPCRSGGSNSPTSLNAAGGFRFPLKQALTAGTLAVTGDTIAQLTEHWRRHKAASKQQDQLSSSIGSDKAAMVLSNHDWLRALRMASYGFLLYGPGSYAWYQFLEHCLPKQTVQNLVLKVVLNQVILGPSVIAVVFAWNSLWQGKLSQLPGKYQRDALPTLFSGLRFWIPVSILNFWLIPLQARVAFMSMGSIFWNFCLSSTISK
ncbi:Protein SYM1 [Linum grandiflorum]